jgi:hypothetical protein
MVVILYNFSVISNNMADCEVGATVARQNLGFLNAV